MNEPNARATMNIFESTRRYENWMRRHVQLISSQLVDKHAMMKGDLFAFFRGTYYRWAQLWRSAVPKSVQAAPAVLAVGDLHVDSFGTWRDVEGRLIWGVDDFDEAFPLPYTNDLVRLAASVKIAAKAGALKISLRDACDAITESAAGGPAGVSPGGAESAGAGIAEIPPLQARQQNCRKRKPGTAPLRRDRGVGGRLYRAGGKGHGALGIGLAWG
jgi:hypothetical protein